MEETGYQIEKIVKLAKAGCLPSVFGTLLMIMAFGIVSKDRSDKPDSPTHNFIESTNPQFLQPGPDGKFPEGAPITPMPIPQEVYDELATYTPTPLFYVQPTPTKTPNPDAGMEAAEKMVNSFFRSSSDSSENSNHRGTEPLQPAIQTSNSGGICGQIERDKIGWRHKFEVTTENGTTIVTFSGNPDNFVGVRRVGRRLGCEEISGIVREVE